jgi:hypothetical protein
MFRSKQALALPDNNADQSIRRASMGCLTQGGFEDCGCPSVWYRDLDFRSGKGGPHRRAAEPLHCEYGNAHWV